MGPQSHTGVRVFLTRFLKIPLLCFLFSFMVAQSGSLPVPSLPSQSR